MRVPLSVAADQFSLFLLQFHLETDWGQEWLEMEEEILLGNSGVEVQQVQHLPFHQVDLSQAKTKSFETFDRGISCPVLVLGAGIIEVLCCQDQGGEEDSVHGTAHALGNGRKFGLQTGEIYQ